MEIIDLLSTQDIFMQVQAPAKRAVIRQLSRHLADITERPALAVSSALLDREALGSTGIGHGIGLPHALMGDIGRPAAALAVLGDPIEFGPPDAKPVDVVLAVVWPRKDAFAFNRALSSFCRILHRPDALKGLRHAASAGEALSRLEAVTLAVHPVNDTGRLSEIAGRTMSR